MPVARKFWGGGGFDSRSAEGASLLGGPGACPRKIFENLMQNGAF